MNYNDKKFRPISNTENGETSNETFFITSKSEIFLLLNIQMGRLNMGI